MVNLQQQINTIMKFKNLPKGSWSTKSKDAKNADTRIKYCKDCNRCWEITLEDNYSKIDRRPIYYVDFPVYGKIKETCDLCKGEQNGKDVIHKLLV